MRNYDTYFPVALRLNEKRVVIVGGDHEAEMKVDKLIPTGARIKVISADATERIRERAQTGQIQLVERDYRRGDLLGAAMAIICDADRGKEARAEADENNVLLNVLDQTELCDFIAVAYFCRDGLQFAVHSSGKSAALSRRIRERLEQQHGQEYATLVRALGEVREEIARLIPSSKLRRDFWLEQVDAELLEDLDRLHTFPTQLDAKRVKADLLARAAAFSGALADHGSASPLQHAAGPTGKRSSTRESD